MKIPLLLTVLALSCPAIAQIVMVPILPDREKHLRYMQVQDAYVFVKGYWEPVDKNDKGSALTGPSVSQLTCSRDTMECEDLQANILITGDAFQVVPDRVTYQIDRWNKKELVAKNTGGICRVLNVLRFDFAEQKVYYMQTLSEPLPSDLPQLSKDLCKLVSMNLELHDEMLFHVQASGVNPSPQGSMH